MTVKTQKGKIRLELTAEQQERVRRALGKEVPALELIPEQLAEQLEEVDAQLEALKGDERNITRRLEASVAAQKDAEARLRQLQQRAIDLSRINRRRFFTM